MRKMLLSITLLLAAAPALAHPGHAENAGFGAGLLHPLTGVDHLLAMLLVGIWSGIAFPRHWWVCPSVFMVFLLGGYANGLGGGSLPAAEILILGSVLFLGLALLFDIRPPLALSATLVALFAIGHGHAHGAELPQGGNSLLFAAGFLVATAMLHLAGLGVTRLAMNTAAPVARIMGGCGAAIGAAMVWTAA